MSEPQDGLKAVITQNSYGNYEIELEEEDLSGYTKELLWRTAYTLNGARRKARKMLARERQIRSFRGMQEVIR